MFNIRVDKVSTKEPKEKQWHIETRLSRTYTGTKEDAVQLALEDAEHIEDMTENFGIMVKDIDVVYRGEVNDG